MNRVKGWKQMQPMWIFICIYLWDANLNGSRKGEELQPSTIPPEKPFLENSREKLTRLDEFTFHLVSRSTALSVWPPRTDIAVLSMFSAMI